MLIRVELNTEAMTRFLKQVSKEALPRAATRALNKTGNSAKSVAVKAVAAQIGIAQKDVRPYVLLQKAAIRCLDTVLRVATGKRVPLIKIDPRAKQGLTGVTYRASGNLRRLIPQAFIATMPSGHRGIYKRVKGAARLPIHELSGPSILYVFKQEVVQDQLSKTVEERWPVVFEHEIRFELQKGKRG